MVAILLVVMPALEALYVEYGRGFEVPSNSLLLTTGLADSCRL